MNAPLNRDRLARLLGSSCDGEVCAAARMAHKLVCGAGLTRSELLNPPMRNLPGVRRDIAVEIKECLVAADALTDWECSFIRSLGGCHRFSERQREILDRILAKVRRAQRRQAA
jgi:hypothetical protein